MAEPGKKKSRVSIMAVKSNTRSMANFGLKSISRLKIRKASFGFGGVPGIRPIERTSQVGTTRLSKIGNTTF